MSVIACIDIFFTILFALLYLAIYPIIDVFFIGPLGKRPSRKHSEPEYWWFYSHPGEDDDPGDQD